MYDVFDNNCECLVMWCKSGLNTSLQVKEKHKTIFEAAKGVIHSAVNDGIEKVAPKVLANVADEAFSAISESLLPLGIGVGAVIEICLLVRSILNDSKKLKQRIISKKQFKINTVKTITKAVHRFDGGIVGSFIGSALGPIGSIVGGVIGAFVGPLVRVLVGKCYENAPKIKEVITKVATKICKKAKKISKKFIGFFKSLFGN